MKEYKITIKVADGKVSAENAEEAKELATKMVRDIYLHLDCECTVMVEAVEEVK